jgi:hypothetical protein
MKIITIITIKPVITIITLINKVTFQTNIKTITALIKYPYSNP